VLAEPAHLLISHGGGAHAAMDWCTRHQRSSQATLDSRTAQHKIQKYKATTFVT